MRNYVKLDFMYPQHEFLLKQATLTYLNWKSKLHQLMQSSLRSSWNLNDRREKSWRWQRHCFWNPKVRRKSIEMFCKVFKLTNFELKQYRIPYNWFDTNSLDGRVRFEKKLVIEIQSCLDNSFPEFQFIIFYFFRVLPEHVEKSVQGCNSLWQSKDAKPAMY